MATKHNTHVPVAALATIFLALAVGSMPVAALVVMSERMQVLK